MLGKFMAKKGKSFVKKSESEELIPPFRSSRTIKINGAMVKTKNAISGFSHGIIELSDGSIVVNKRNLLIPSTPSSRKRGLLKTTYSRLVSLEKELPDGITVEIPEFSIRQSSSPLTYLLTYVDLDFIENSFISLAEKWYLETLHSSGYLDKVLHPAYQRIIGLGKGVIPFILRELQDEPSEWFWALRALTGEDPTTEEMAGNRKKLAEAWLNWGKENGYI
jgi:hypothetical protein